MIIHEFGDRSKPHILLLHGMNMNHTTLLAYFDSFRETHHIIAPDFTGHGEDRGSFLSARNEAEQIVEWLSKEKITELDLIYSVSLGGVVAMYVAAREDVLKVNCFVSEGASLTRVKGVEWIFYKGMKKIRDNPEMIFKMYRDMDTADKELIEQLFSSIQRTDDTALRNMVHTCNSFEYEKCPLSERAQRRMFFEYGSKDSHILAKGLIKKFYPEAEIIVRKGEGHCTFPEKHKAEYPDILRGYMKSALDTWGVATNKEKEYEYIQ